MWPERAKPRTKDFVREWQYVLSSLGSGPDGGCWEKSRAEAHERGGKGEATAEHRCCAQYSWAYLFLHLEAFYLSRASSLFCSSLFFLFPLSSSTSTLFSYFLSLPNLFWSLSSFICCDFPFPSPSFWTLFFLSSFLSLPNGFLFVYSVLLSPVEFLNVIIFQF